MGLRALISCLAFLALIAVGHTAQLRMDQLGNIAPLSDSDIIEVEQGGNLPVAAATIGQLRTFINIGAVQTGNVIAFNHSADLHNAVASPYTVAYTPGVNSKILWLGLEYDDNSGACTSPTATFGGTAMTRVLNTPRSGPAGTPENPQAEFVLINAAGFAATPQNVVVTCAGATYFDGAAADYTDTGTPVFDTAGVTVDTLAESTYTSSFNVATAGDWVMLHASNSGNTTTATAGGAGAALRLGNDLHSNGLFDSGGPVSVTGNYSMTTTIGFNVNGRTNHQTHSFLTFKATAPPPTLSGVALSSSNFTTPANPNLLIATLTAQCSGAGGCPAGATFAPGTTDTTATGGGNCSGANSANNGLFAIGPSNLNVGGTQITGSPVTEKIGVAVTLAGATNSGACFPQTLTGTSAPTPNNITFTPVAGTVAANVPAGTVFGSFVVNMTDNTTNYPGTPGITACANFTLVTCPFGIGAKTGNSWAVQTTATPIAASSTDSITVTAN